MLSSQTLICERLGNVKSKNKKRRRCKYLTMRTLRPPIQEVIAAGVVQTVASGRFPLGMEEEGGEEAEGKS